MISPRIVSLLPSSTEIICALGLAQNLVGILHECDYPASICHLPVCTAPRFNPHISSLKIDQSVKALVKEGLSIYQVNSDLLEWLSPDFIITQSQCELCAVSFNDVQRAVCQFTGSQSIIINLEPNELKDIFSDIQKVAAALDIAEKGAHYINQLADKINIVKFLIQKSKLINLNRRILPIEWLAPLLSAGNWIPEMIETVGGINLMGRRGEHSHYLQWNDIIDVDPDSILIMPCGFDLARTRREMHLFTSLPHFADLTAARNGQVYITDGNAYFNRPRPRIVDTIEMLAEILYPEVFPARYTHAYQPWQVQ